MNPLLPRIPLPLLPLCIKAVRAAADTAGWLYCAICDVHGDLVELHAGKFGLWQAVDPDSYNAYLYEPRCYSCSAPDPDHYCAKCAVLNTGRVES